MKLGTLGISLKKYDKLKPKVTDEKVKNQFIPIKSIAKVSNK